MMDASQRMADVSSITSGTERLRPLVLKAAEHGAVEELRMLIQKGKQEKTLDDTLLRWSLQKAAEKGQAGTVDLLLQEDVDWDSSGSGDRGLTPLYRAVQRGHKDIVKKLLERGANLEGVDKSPRSVLHAAAWWNRIEILRMLLDYRADVNSRDRESRSVIHGLAADKTCRWGVEVVDMLLNTPVDLEYPDDLKRTALHWAAVMGKEKLTQQLLLRKIYPPADVHATTDRGKTALHLAALHGHGGVVKLLLAFGADPTARSDGGWTALHYAAHKGHRSVIEVLLQHGCNVNVCTSAGMTPLHWASQEGHMDAVNCLLSHPEVWWNSKDVEDRTPLVCAAENRHIDIVKVLAPLVDVKKLSHYAVGACDKFKATVVDFGTSSNRVTRHLPERSVYEVLYGDSVTTLVNNVKSKPAFRWIHLPANNMAWIETLITKAFLEDGATDIEGLRALQATFSQQHRGPTIYSRSMRPLCKRIHRSARPSEDLPTAQKQMPESETATLARVVTDSTVSTSKDTRGPVNVTPKTNNKDTENGPPKSGSRSGAKQKGGTKGPSGPKNQANTARRDRALVAPPPRGNMVLFAPYLHFETERKRAEMIRAIRDAGADRRRKRVRQATTADEMLIRAYLYSSTQLHVRRSHDHFYLHGIDAADEAPPFFRGDEAAGQEKKVLMVDQLWMWILGRDLIITSFPQRWEQPPNDSYNVLDGIIEGISSRTGEPIKSVYDLATLITSRCFSVFDRQRMRNEDNQLLNMFEATIGKMVEEESTLFSHFYRASSAATAWLKRKRRSLRHRSSPSKRYKDMEVDQLDDILEEPSSQISDSDEDEEPLFVDSLLDVGKETMLMTQCKDAQDKLQMVHGVLEDQQRILVDMHTVIRDDVAESAVQRRATFAKKFDELGKKVETHRHDVRRMYDQAGDTYDKIIPLLDLKQKHANAFEARFARDQAASSARQGQVIMVFTIVTIVFLPMSFIASFFAINISQFPKDSSGGGMNLGYICKIVFPVGLGISIPLIALAFSLNSFRAAQRSVLRSLRRRHHPSPTSSSSPSQEDVSKIQSFNRFSRDEKRSLETGRSIALSPPGINRTLSGGSAWSRGSVKGRARWRDIEEAAEQ